MSDTRSDRLRRGWSVITRLLLAGFLLEAVFAGAILSGVGWASMAHRVTAATLVASTIAASVVAVITLRHAVNGPKLGFMLLGLALLAFLQAALGALAAKGSNLLWAHVPLGVALFGLAVRAAAGARTLDEG